MSPNEEVLDISEEEAMDINNADKNIVPPQEYWDVLIALMPIAICGGIAGGLRFLKTAHIEKTLTDKIISLIFSVLCSAIIATVGILLLPHIILIPVDIRMELGIAFILGSMGTKSVDIILRKIFNLSITELESPRPKRPYKNIDIDKE